MGTTTKGTRIVHARGRLERMAPTRRAVLVIACLTVTLATTCRAPASAAPPDAAGVAFFETHIRPLLVERCQECHSRQSGKARGGLRLDQAEDLRKGGSRGPAIDASQPRDSLLLQAVRHDDPDLQMPPKGKLPPREVELLTRWVEMGAPDPRLGAGAVQAPAPVDIEAGRKFWSFRPPVDPPLPRAANPAWARSPIDMFVLAALERAGLRPSPQTDKYALIRRATLDLTGLPPTPEEVNAFVSDDSPAAYERLVDRLLASNAHGERWGRHWLDVARYADSNGLDENVAHGNAWRYRDYVIASFNRDKPFDRFLQEQLAGDLLEPDPTIEESHDPLIATGFLSLGPKVLAEVDETKMEMDIVDEQIETVGRAFLGLTLGCARCHDHKFDPFPTSDYYGLAGIFRSTRAMENFKKVARWWENDLSGPEDRAKMAAFESRKASLEKSIQEMLRQGTEALRTEKGPGFQLPKDPEPLFSEAARSTLKRLRDEIGAHEKTKPTPPSAMGVTEGTVADVRIHQRGSHLSLGAVVPRRVPVVLAASQPSFSGTSSGRLEMARWITESTHPLTARVAVNRIWRWHFGRGLVGSIDNFGSLGERPTHPELLDWLATRFVRGGWSMKALHREIMLSATYRMSSRYDEASARVDPENRLLWRYAPRRLEAESVRDAMLAVAGTLDRSMGGSMLKVANRGYFFDHTSKDATSYDTRRRSVYLPIVRNHLFDAFELFDFADPGVSSGGRSTTTVAPQALFLLNSDFVEKVGAELASRLLATPGDDSWRVGVLFLRAHGRPASATEIERTGGFLARLSRALEATGANPLARRQRAWELACQAILSSSEFLYIP